MSSGVIPHFKGEYLFLSNSYETNIVWRGERYSSADQAYLSAKLDYGEAWEAMKVRVVHEIVHAKFATSDKNIVGPLLNTGSKMLVNGGKDTFWGRGLDPDTGKMVGFNTLGVILMEQRGYWRYSDFSDKRE